MISSDSQAALNISVQGFIRFGTQITSLGLDTMNTDTVSSNTPSLMLLDAFLPSKMLNNKTVNVIETDF